MKLTENTQHVMAQLWANLQGEIIRCETLVQCGYSDSFVRSVFKHTIDPIGIKQASIDSLKRRRLVGQMPMTKELYITKRGKEWCQLNFK